MSDSFEDITGKNQSARRACRVAYTINNTQPVISTIIGDQPLFYMDFDYGYEDEENPGFDAADMGILESEIHSLKREIDSIEKLSAGFTTHDENKTEDFIENAQDIISRKTDQNVLSMEPLLEI
ncbi:MAG: hypothetical protein KDI11_08215, partial [Alphaproteobacteria bacterium]|nr:hypothetical protein [Alphaproteobacteria bacterium]